MCQFNCLCPGPRNISDKLERADGTGIDDYFVLQLRKYSNSFLTKQILIYLCNTSPHYTIQLEK